MATKAQLEANKRYLEKMEELRVWVKQGKREEVRKYATDNGYASLAEYIKEIVKKDSGIEL